MPAEDWLLKVEHLAGALVARRVARLQPDSVRGRIATVDAPCGPVAAATGPNGKLHIGLLLSPLDAVVPLRCDHHLILLGHVVAEAVDVVLEDEVVDLARVTRLGARDPVVPHLLLLLLLLLLPLPRLLLLGARAAAVL